MPRRRADPCQQHGRAERHDTLVINYDKAIANVLPQLEQFWVLPEHVWSKLTGNDGKDLKAYQPAGPPADGGRRAVLHLEVPGQGHHGVQAQPGLLRPQVARPGRRDDVLHQPHHDDRRHASPATSTSSIRCPSTPSARSRATAATRCTRSPSSEVTNITFNSNPLKKKNRELLNPKVKEALEYATDRNQIVQIVYTGYARPWANILSSQSGDLARSVDQAAAVRRRQGQPDPRQPRLQEGFRRDSRGAGDHRQVRPAGPQDGLRPDGAGEPRLQRRPPVPDHAATTGPRWA